MNVPKSKIEENADHEIEGIARLHNALSPEIASNDMVMSYDGLFGYIVVPNNIAKRHLMTKFQYRLRVT